MNIWERFKRVLKDQRGFGISEAIAAPLVDTLGATAANAVGTGLLGAAGGAGLSALTGGNVGQGALFGGFGGGAGSLLGSAVGGAGAGLSGLSSLFSGSPTVAGTGSGSGLLDSLTGGSTGTAGMTSGNLTAGGALDSATSGTTNAINGTTQAAIPSSTAQAVQSALSSNANTSTGLLGKNPLATLGILAQAIGATQQSQANTKALAAQQAAQQQFNQNAYNTITNMTPLNRQLSVTPQTVGNLNNYGQAGYTGWNGQGGNQLFYNNVNPASYQFPALKAGGKVKYATGGISSTTPNWAGAWQGNVGSPPPLQPGAAAIDADQISLPGGGTYVPGINNGIGEYVPPGMQLMGIMGNPLSAGGGASMSYGLTPLNSLPNSTSSVQLWEGAGSKGAGVMSGPDAGMTVVGYPGTSNSNLGLGEAAAMFASMMKSGGQAKKKYATGGKVNYASGGQADPYTQILQSLVASNQPQARAPQSLVASNQPQARAPQPLENNPMRNQGPSLASILQAMQQTGNTQTSTIDPTRVNNPMSYSLNSQVYPQAQQATRIEAALSGQPYAKGGGVKVPKVKGLQISKTTQLTLPTTNAGLNPGLQPQIQTPPQGLQPSGVEGLPQGLAGGGVPRIMNRTAQPQGLPMETMPNRIHPNLTGMMPNRFNPANPSMNMSPLRMMASGGALQGPGGGQDDKIPAKLSAGEFIVPAESVSDLGDGDNNEGARKLNAMLKNIRKHKNSAKLTGPKGQLRPKAKPVVQYLKSRKIKK